MLVRLALTWTGLRPGLSIKNHGFDKPMYQSQVIFITCFCKLNLSHV